MSITQDFTDTLATLVEKSNTKEEKRSSGQFFTPSIIAKFMCSLFNDIKGKVSVLDPGCGVGSLINAFIEEAVLRQEFNSIDATIIDLDSRMSNFIDTLNQKLKISYLDENINISFKNEDYILQSNIQQNTFTHIIMNPPYLKIRNSSKYRIELNKKGIITGNLYAGFLGLSIQQLKEKGELVAIVPRSFANGLYFLPFRKLLLSKCSIKQIHLFDRRNSAFSDQNVLQENVILHLSKGTTQGMVKISSSPDADFIIDKATNKISIKGYNERNVSINQVVQVNDPFKFIHIAVTKEQQNLVDKMQRFSTKLEDLNVEVSTGPVVDFRVKSDLRRISTKDSYPLIYPTNVRNSFTWPIHGKKPIAIVKSKKTDSSLWDNVGSYIIIKRLTSKEENKRIQACIYNSSLDSDKIGFDNKLNIIHYNKKGLNETLAKGLFIYLTCTLVDQYYRSFSGNTQVNATDLRNMKYPNLDTLLSFGNTITPIEDLTQDQIDKIVDSFYLKTEK